MEKKARSTGDVTKIVMFFFLGSGESKENIGYSVENYERPYLKALFIVL